VLSALVDRGLLSGGLGLTTSATADIAVETVGYDRASLFWIASMTKPITATLVAQLVDDGLIDLDAPVTDYLPEFTPRLIQATPDAAALVTPQRRMLVRHLLAHTSGLPFSSSLETWVLDGLPIATQVAGYALTPLNSEPGTRYDYSNAGFNVAARVIEVVTGSAYESVLDERLLGPLGMSDTTFWPSAGQLTRLVHPTAVRDGELLAAPLDAFTEPLDDRMTRHPFAGGGLFSTLDDVARFARMILAGGVHDGRRLVSADSIRAMTTPQVTVVGPEGYPGDPSTGATGYALGWATRPDGAFGHGGAHFTQLWIHPAAGTATIWMIAHGGTSTGPDEVAREFVRVMDDTA
jgi:CubicO group peptidase (beta-lactamase class C family)